MGGSIVILMKTHPYLFIFSPYPYPIPIPITITILILMRNFLVFFLHMGFLLRFPLPLPQD